ncbi:hypothetical protein HPB48_008497 [Haemaphysalis longicornis]|uniref:Uncharacterized protein n=1 Tax=Haemaphysalis longicornis TaxID=44386 RepID=A0A9J6GTZ4_HAELO|nr:hypothetical protein HPB48_008497 [Haemaphysalis longicornis]
MDAASWCESCVVPCEKLRGVPQKQIPLRVQPRTQLVDLEVIACSSRQECGGDYERGNFLLHRLTKTKQCIKEHTCHQLKSLCGMRRVEFRYSLGFVAKALDAVPNWKELETLQKQGRSASLLAMVNS